MTAAGQADDDDAPLAGVRVLDLSRLLPGPYACWHLRRLGAEVLKIEDPGPGDPARVLMQTEDERLAGQPSLFFRRLNEGKRLQRIDLADAAGREALLGLVRDADVLVEGFRPGVMDRLGLGWTALRAANPRLVMCSISGWGRQGPWAGCAGHDINYLAQAGVLQQIATREGRPVLPNFQIADLFGGTQAAVAGILAGLLGVQRHGRGRHVDISMAHVVHAHHLLPRLQVERSGHAPPPGADLLTGGAPCYNLYRTQDARWMAVGALELKFWRRVCEVLGRPEWGERHWSLGQAVGGEDARALQTDVAALFARETQAHWTARFEPADCCVSPVLSMEEAMRHPLFADAPA
ncbi:CoA transferase [Aquabacterium sp. A7-Y]|uniref:CaiB/BaiF CoA transferase family protein n=1 Tax=Aquabacterium sp. A7-Y TaxID=1349605 RepID=UPI00223D617F|nr:CaiB/BaiF CoA-transferase family protein [Aquabacterium sp. A7-Y]MCW7537663.1 CoA transferase [Aquabacterium sp. A7-Y]